MKLCQTCGQSLAEEIATCPSCGGEVGEGRRHIDDYHIQEVLHEGHATTLCRAVKGGQDRPVMIRIFTPQSGVDEEVAERLKRELEELKKLPAEDFVQHYEIRRSAEGLWYRVSEWIEAESWGDLIASGRLQDYSVAFDLFARIASKLAVLHQAGHIIPHLILNDIIVLKDETGRLDVKIDYKLSRFFDPKLDRPGPTLKRLLDCHPDILNDQPLEPRSDIWSLGKIFVEVLTADFESCDFLAQVEELPLPPEVEVLFKTMLAEDPELRPSHMSEVAEVLAGVSREEIGAARQRRQELASAPAREIRRLKKGQLVLLAMVVAALAVLVWFQFSPDKRDEESTLRGYANRYAASVAFVTVEYWLEEDQHVLFRKRTEGTAFLVDKEGYLLTNRHVACPWLEDETLFLAISQLKSQGREARFGYRMFLWFEGQKAFNRTASLTESPDLEDVYFLDSAYGTDREPRLTIAGVAKPLVKTRQVVKSPLRDDFAVLKVDRPPQGLKPLPLDAKLDPQSLPRLSPVFTLGFPLGSRTQEASVNVSVTRGHVRRSFENMVQVDTSLYGGNSGGPMIDLRGQVIGIASGVATDRASGVLPLITPLWDMGLVLPITKAAAFLAELKAGQVKWNGVLDLSLEAKQKRIIDTAAQGRWAEAMALADGELKLNLDPLLVTSAGMMHLCAGDDQGARRLFELSLSLDVEDDLAKLMLYLIDWRAGRASDSRQRQELLDLDWRSPAEFFGYLARILEGQVELEAGLKGFESRAEKSWLGYVGGLILAGRGEWTAAEGLLREAVLTADTEAWEYFLARARLDQVQKRRLEQLRAGAGWAEYQAGVESFQRALAQANRAKAERRARLAELRAALEEDSAGPDERRRVLESLLASEPGNQEPLVGLVFYCAMGEDWSKALEYARAFLERPGRESANQLSLGLLEAEMLNLLDRWDEARACLEAFVRRTREPWYRAVCENLLGKGTEESLRQEAGEGPEKLVTLHTALGLWAEGSGDKDRAIRHYREALESYLDTWLEFDLAAQRLKKLRRPSS